MKILFFASYPTLAIGYSRIANILSNYLSSEGHEIYYFGISNYKQVSVKRYIHPKIVLIDALEEEQKIGSSELYGVNTICDFIEKIKPDILFLYNDLIVISRIFNNFIEKKVEKTFKIITYLDLVYPYEKINLIKHIDFFSDVILVFGEFWKQNLINIGLNSNKIEILPHGFDSEIFFPIEQNDAKEFFNFKPDDFIILNSNRNSYRKNISQTIDAFIKFLKIKNLDKKIKLFLNMKLNLDYDIHNQINIACIKNNIDYSEVILNHIFINGAESSYSDETLNLLYNACDVGINTCIGEGFGLCNLEHGGLAKPQIISGVGGLNDIFQNEYASIINPIEEYYIPNHMDFHGGYAVLCKTDDFVDAMSKYYDDKELYNSHATKSESIIKTKYNWDSILKKLDIIIKSNYYSKK